MQDIEEKILNNFENNIAYFEKEHPELYEKLSILNIAINDGSYEEKYHLEYLDDNYFDILEVSSDTYLYNRNTNEHAKELAKSVNYKKNNSVVEGFYNENITFEDVQNIENKKNIRDPLYATARIINYTQSVTTKNDEMDELVKYIFCGVGLGLHIKEIIQKINPYLIFITEDNLELFRLSLFTINYKELATNRILIYSIMHNSEEFSIIFNYFYKQAYTHNHYIKYTLLTESEIQKVKTIQQLMVSSSHLTFSYSVRLLELLRAPEYIIDNYPFLPMEVNTSRYTPLSDQPILLIASGPSLRNNSKWLQDNKNKFIIIAVLSSVQTLYKLNVKPDIVIHMDSSPVSTAHLKEIDINTFFKNTLFILSSVVSKNVPFFLKKDQIYFVESSVSYKKGFKVLIGPSVGEVSYGISVILGAKEIYLLGLDLALDPKTMKTHSEDHVVSTELKEDDEDSMYYTSFAFAISSTKGNFIEEIPTTPVFNSSIEGFNIISSKLKNGNHKTYNLNNGAFLNNTIPLHIENFNTDNLETLNKAKKLNEIKNFFNEISEISMNENDIKNLNLQIKEAQRLLNLVQLTQKSNNPSNYDDYLSQFYELYQELLNLNQDIKYDINKVMSSYIQLVVSYIFDLINTKNLTNKKNHYKKINKIYLNQIEKILDLYLKTMNVYKMWIKK